MQKIVKFTDDKYICPQKAIRKFRSAKKLRTPLYLYGVTGIGKTSLVMHNLNMKHCLYYSASETSADQIKIKEQTAEYTVILDDLQCVTDSTEREHYFEIIRNLLMLDQVWLILIARCPFPRWLLPLRTKYIFAEIEENDFLFTIDEQIAYLEQYHLQLPREEHQSAWNVGGGNPLSLLFFAMEKGNLELTKRKQWDYLETHVYDQWDLELQEFFMDISIVETFNVSLASMLTGRGDVEKLIFRAEEVGNFFDIRGVNGIWKCRWPMRKSMQQRLHRKRTLDQINHLYYTAGLYYELEGQLPEALTMYEKYNDTGSISRLLISNARKNPSSGHYYELRRYYLELPEEIISGSPVLMAGISLLQSMLMNIEESERWYHTLEKFAQEHTGSLGKEARSQLLYLKIALPHRGSVDMIDLLKNADILIHSKKAVLPELSVTSNLPSLMNGGKDFCEWSKRDKELAFSIGKPVEFVLGKYGKGLVSLALAESYLEKGKDIFEIFSRAERGRMDADRGGKLEQVFVGVGILAWLSVLKSDADGAASSLKVFRERAEKEAPNLLPNIDAFICRIHLYQAKDVSEWMKQAPDENGEFCTMDRFCYLTKARVYISMEKLENAYCLLQQILHYAEIMKRTYIHIEGKILLAIVQYRLEQEEWKETLQECISQAESYHFIRIFSREGPALMPMFEKKKFIWKDQEFRAQVLAESKQMAKTYPSYLNADSKNNVALGENALRILWLQSEGMSSGDIAKELKISEATVKYHNKETYRKLGVRNKAAAIAEAKKRRLI
ncbi:LuxR C-terminal-related transcriptional regulator [Blautia sp. MSJ-19]|uniref:LuxR C-terminal-related transcriptional regulator n=1 Tax=Blautia sp. MSJ-19 TaxID=2841517 RepID=UPI001C0EA9AC|nr:LuxR C-terminal-related transcriptional regulator [Blautia sp. MSJ-19]MBU5479845.1 LuxR C-terminal-related transcriptional regulator [Blautia sp. MSJ-19]